MLVWRRVAYTVEVSLTWVTSMTGCETHKERNTQLHATWRSQTLNTTFRKVTWCLRFSHRNTKQTTAAQELKTMPQALMPLCIMLTLQAIEACNVTWFTQKSMMIYMVDNTYQRVCNKSQKGIMAVSQLTCRIQWVHSQWGHIMSTAILAMYIGGGSGQGVHNPRCEPVKNCTNQMHMYTNVRATITLLMHEYENCSMYMMQ